MGELDHTNFEAIAFGFEGVLAEPYGGQFVDGHSGDSFTESRYGVESDMVPGLDEFVGRAAEAMDGGLWVVSSAAHDTVSEFLLKHGLRDYFADECIVGPAGGKGPNPDPAPYVEILRRAGLSHEQKKLLVIENNGLLIEAARKSGAVAVGLVHAPGGGWLRRLRGIQHPNVPVGRYEELGGAMGLTVSRPVL